MHTACRLTYRHIADYKTIQPDNRKTRHIDSYSHISRQLDIYLTRHLDKYTNRHINRRLDK